ncbi:uncharacterized protein LOC136090751 [Hydra vulgaris]|uniref:Uncharacterized protein LOC136090751 n=1 Tax=Hydra vulgaris TaxID=6087 RepID=A0ABM4DGW2_HYDVU
MAYAVIEFCETNQVEVISTNWFVLDQEEFCLWPPKKLSTKAQKMAKNRVAPDAQWDEFEIRVLGKAATYTRARKKLQHAEDTSDLNFTEQEAEEKDVPIRQKRIATRKISSDFESEIVFENDIDYFPLKKKKLAGKTQLSATTQILPPSFSVPFSVTASNSPTLITTLPIMPISYETPFSSLEVAALMTPTQCTQLSNTTTGCMSRTVTTTSPVSNIDVVTVQNIGSALSCNNISNQTMHGLVVQLLKVCVDIQQTQAIHTNMLNAMLSQGNVMVQPSRLPDGIIFPMDTMKAFDAIEMKLKDINIANIIVNFLAGIGGRKVDEAIRRMMQQLLNNNLALQFNCQRGQSKRVLKGTELFQVIYKALKLNNLTSTCTMKDFEMSLAKWLIGARDRDGNRAKRGEARKQSNKL